MNDQIFLCYSRRDASPHAWMLYRCLHAAGYRVSVCPESEIQGASAPSDRTVPQDCTDVLILLSPAAFSDASPATENTMYREIRTALDRHIPTTGIRLTGFESFPAELPADLSFLRTMPCLDASADRFDEMVQALLSGRLHTQPQSEAAVPLPSAPVCCPEDSLTDALRAFARNPAEDQKIQLLNDHLEPMELTLRLLQPAALESLLDFQTAVVSGIPDVARTNLFQSLSRQEWEAALLHGICIGALRDGNLAGVLELLPRPTPEQNLLQDLPQYRSIDSDEVLVVDAVLVAGSCRGYGLQRVFYRLADCISRQNGLRYECSVVSPLNYHSLSNTIRSGFRLVGNFPKYSSSRNFFVKELLPEP